MYGISSNFNSTMQGALCCIRSVHWPINQRKELLYPPFNRLCKILFQGKIKSQTKLLANKIAD